MQDEEIICIALLKVKLLDQLIPPDIKILAQFFNIPFKGMYQQTLMQLKKSIAYIILIERYDLEEYLSLPKFKRLPNHLHHLLSMYFRNVRECFQNQKRSIQEENLRNLQKTQTGMQKLSNLMKKTVSKVNNPIEQTQVGFNRYGFYNHFNQSASDSRLSYSVPPMSNYLFPYQNYVNNNMFQDYANRGSVMNNLMLDISKQHLAPIQIPKKVEQRLRSDYQNFKQEYFSESNNESQEVQVEKGSKYQCFCGKQKEDDVVKCKKCSKEFHFKCWTPVSSEEAVCPFCKLNYKHCYTKLVGEIIIERSEQIVPKPQNVKKFNFSNVQLQKLNQAIKLCQNSDKNWLQIRMLRVKSSIQGQGSGMNSCFNLHISEAKKLCNRKWLQIKLNNVGEGSFLFLNFVCVTPKQFQQFQKQIIEGNCEFDNANLSKRKYSLEEIQNMKVSFIHPITNRLIKIPVRGSRCEHPQCQDLNQVYEMGIKKQSPRIICSFCHKQYSVYEPFQFDPVIGQKLKQIPQMNQSQFKMVDLSEKNSSISIQKQSERPKQSQNAMVDEKQEENEQKLKDQSIQEVVHSLQPQQFQRREQ